MQINYIESKKKLIGVVVIFIVILIFIYIFYSKTAINA